MPRKFTDNEKEYLDKKIHIKGKELFVRYGIKKTTIDEIVRNVGIAKGSFYNFYRTKEDLFFSIYSAENELLEKQFYDFLNGEPKDIKNGLKDFLIKKFTVKTDSAHAILFEKENFEYLNRSISEEKIKEYILKDYKNLELLIQKMQELDIIKNYTATQIAQLFHIVFFLSLKKEELEKYQKFPNDSVELLIDVIIKSI